MGVIFDPVKGIIIDNTDTVREDVREVWKGAFTSPNSPEFSVNPDTPQGQIIDSQTASISAKDTEILYISNQFNLNTAEGKFLDALAQIYFVDRQQATSTTVECTLTGLRDILIPKGFVVQTVSNINLVSTVAATITTAGTVDILFETVDKAPIVIDKNSVTRIVTLIAGVDTVDNAEAGVTGRNQETRTEFSQRIKNSVAINSEGSVAALRSALRNLDGVVSAEVLENDTPFPKEISGIQLPSHSVAMSIFGGDNNDIAKIIVNKKDAGCSTAGNTEIVYIDTENYNAERVYYIERPALFPLGIKVRIKNDSSLPNNIEMLVKQSVLDNFNGLQDYPPVGIAQTLYATRFISSVLIVGVNNLISVELVESGTVYNSIEILASQMPTLSIDDIDVNIEE